MEDFLYSRSTEKVNGDYGKEVKKSVKAGRSSWRKGSHVICDTRTSRMKEKVYEMVAGSSMLWTPGAVWM